MNSTLDGQKSRSNATQKALMLAAEKLIAARGIENVSIREIVKTAGQKNESALQYHFGNFRGLVSAIRKKRDKEIHAKRAVLLDELISKSGNPTLRDLCYLMASPSFLMAKLKPDFRRYVVGFSHELALTSESAFTLASKAGGGGESGQKTGKLLLAALPHLNEDAYRRRMESVVRLAAISLGHHARSKNAFRGAAAELFFNNLVDEMAGLLMAPVSPETASIEKSIKKRPKKKAKNEVT
jgi:AcrR family transcriptional regulator